MYVLPLHAEAHPFSQQYSRGHLCPKCLYVAPCKDKELSTLKCPRKASDNAEPKKRILQPYARKVEFHCWGVAIFLILMQDFTV